jgi:hypothetical protein
MTPVKKMIVRTMLAAARREAVPRYNAAYWSLGDRQAAANASRFFLGYQCSWGKGILLAMAETGARAATLFYLLIGGRRLSDFGIGSEQWLHSDPRQLRCKPAACTAASWAVGVTSFWKGGGVHLFHFADRRSVWTSWVEAVSCWPVLLKSRRRMSRRGFAGHVCRQMSDGGLFVAWEILLTARILSRTGGACLNYAGQFDRWVDLLSELRHQGSIRRLEFHQHGAIEIPEAGIWNVRPVVADRFVAMFPESQRYLRQNWLLSPTTAIAITSSKELVLKNWGGPRAAAIILQDPRISGELNLIRWFKDFCARNEIEALAYLHPRFGELTRDLLTREFPGLVICSEERHQGLAFYLTRFSTLGVELAGVGERVVFAGWLGQICVLSSGMFNVAYDEASLAVYCSSFIKSK